ncbi:MULTISPECIES: GDP-L-fucose synthase family protein [unclassified Chryseobacterium]|uniref:GDP-L-fucose synthase family protein n=1 Tax=unclassified Chryseobacterium TaxID=2593645 RepID=UPI001AE472A8|nr:MULTISPECIES: GDP-L-fucose synthase [unclassified Chryseobacterium]MBP1166181.1 GDP-L-fucose synthase [Chryseobacterium sp. PvR013]MDR4891362.1 GDP-L-fucose synthase [Chryseobacterium sp. CFS7]
MNQNSKIYIAGHRGMVGSAILRNLISNGFNNIVTKTSDELDLTDQKKVQAFFESEKPEYVFLAAAKVGGILANNTYRADFLYENLMIESNVIHQSYLQGVKKLLFLGSSCIYPKLAPQPLKEEYLLSGFLEETNEPYAIAKIAGIKMCDAYRTQYDCNFISAMPTNLYGPNDNYDLHNSHVLPAMLRKFFEAQQNNVKEVVLWGDGSPFREFLHVDDLAKACVFLMNNYNDSGHVNIGSSREISILELAMQIKDITQYEGNIVWDTEKPNGTPRKLMDSSKINSMGWSPNISLEEGIKQVYQEKFLNK